MKWDLAEKLNLVATIREWVSRNQRESLTMGLEQLDDFNLSISNSAHSQGCEQCGEHALGIKQ